MPAGSGPPSKRQAPEHGYSVTSQTQRWLDALDAMSDERLAVLGALALDLARTLDESSAARDRAALAKELRSTCDQIAEIQAALHPEEEAADGVDDLEAARARRRAAEG